MALKKGLQPSSITKTNNWKHTNTPSRADCVYLSDIYGGYFAIAAGGNL